MSKKTMLEKLKDFDLLTVINAVAPSYESLQDEVRELRESFPNKSNQELAHKFGNRLRKKYTSIGVVSALPSTIPGPGTAAQIGIEAVTISGDLALMLRWMAGTCYGVGLIYDKNIESEFSQEFIRVLGMWCGAIESVKKGTEKITTKVAIAQFNRNVSGKVLQTINRRVGTTIFTKYGAKRGGIALGKLIPFGVGALVGGSFNYYTMNGFKKKAIKYFESDENTEYIIYENTE
ncbi:hypothetical protein ACQY1Q_17335 [Tenacibaculum sp. TC6]|uniref:hypothetical protein n=1 Tax=Tenacibaculum sp. TC6 TaxID=3423223 RepID=UPI003D35E63D